MKLVTYLNFSGTCEEAFQFYAKTLGGKIEFLTRNGESPMADHMPAAMKDKVMHASLATPGGVPMGADHPEGESVEPAGFCVSLQLPVLADAERVFRALSEGGRVRMDFQKTFWSPGFGMCTDRFGIPWMVNCGEGT
jgi:PhnB protein